MPASRREFLRGVVLAATFGGLPQWTLHLDEAPPAELACYTWPRPSAYAGVLGAAGPALTVLNRIAFGPRSGDVERVQSIGVDAYIEEQLHPESIDDSAIEERLSGLYPTLSQSIGDLFLNYPPLNQAGASRPDVDLVERLLTSLGLSLIPHSPADVVRELQEATVMRAVYSRRQLQETLVDFWSNHFNIFVNKNNDRWFKTVDDREVIRKNAFGKFKDLLLASASSPAMLEYLDNRLNQKGVPNENYAREVMELHTLGVDGGYTQMDVQELARCLTGWTIRMPRRIGGASPSDNANAGSFYFDARQHDDGPKRVLGLDLSPGGGIGDGLKMIEVLARHPSTANFICKKLVIRYVADVPPEALVQRAAQTFRQSDGEIRAVLSTILHSDEFKNSFGQKTKRPFEFVTSVARILDMQLDDARGLVAALRSMGQAPFECSAPNGYPDSGAAWIDTSRLLAGWNFALLAASNRIPQAHVDLKSIMSSTLLRTAGDLVEFWGHRLLQRSLPDAELQKLIQAVGPDANVPLDAARLPELVSLVLASPDFRYR